MNAVTRLLGEVMGLDGAALGEESLARAVTARCAAAGCASTADYARLVGKSAAEREELIESLVVSETWFFRDQEPFRCLADFVRQGRLRRGRARLRLLSAPCATGEEPYSLAITLLDLGLPPDAFHIDAVDISERALARARAARYCRNSFRGEEALARRAKWFEPEGEEWRLKPEAAAGVRFERANLLSPDFTLSREPYDVIFCRNLLIYLHQDARARILAVIRRLLRPDGLLFTGHTELFFFFSAGFAPVNHPRAFACRPAAAKTAAPAPALVSSARPAPPAVMLPVEPMVRGAAGGGRREAPVGASPDDSLDRLRRLADQGRLDEAYQLGRTLLAAEPTDPELHFLVGLVCQAKDRNDEAENCYRKAVYLEPRHYEALVNLSHLCDLKGDNEGASLLMDRARRCRDEVRAG